VDAPAPDSGELVLTRLLALALPDDAKRSRAIQEALLASKRTEVPTDATELLQFVRAHLAPRLGREVAPNLILALIDDLTLEVKGAASERGPVSQRATSPAMPSTAQPGARRRIPSIADLVSTPFPKLKQSVANLVRTASTKIRAARRAQIDTTTTKVALIEADRMVRATMARALVNAQFDVVTFDTPFEAARLAGSPHSLVTVIDIAAEGAESALRVLAKSFPLVVVVVWTDVPPPIVGAALNDVGIADYHVLPRSAGATEVSETVHRLLAASAPDGAK
jgi:hypothetical protein